MPVSGSTSTSQNWVEKPGAWPPALTEAAAVDRAAGQRRLAGDLLQRQRREIADIAARRPGVAVLPDDAFDIDAPDHRGAGAQLVDELLAGVDDRHAGGEGHARAAGHMGVADRGGVGDDRPHLVVIDPKVSAAISAIEAREPPISGLPVATRIVPSALI